MIQVVFSTDIYLDGNYSTIVVHSDKCTISFQCLQTADMEKVLYDDVVDQATSHSQPGVLNSGQNHPFCFSGVDDCIP